MKGSISNFTVSSDKHLSGARAPITANKAAAPNRRPPFPFAALLPFGYSFCTPPACQAAVGEPHCWAASRMIATRFLVGLVSLCSVGGLWASPRSDLESASPATRAAAAKILRANPVPHPATNWNSLLAALKIGTPMTNVEARLRSVHAQLELKCDITVPCVWLERYRLDDLWLLYCHFHYVSNTLIETKLFQTWRPIYLQPPPHFTGVWTTYYANGQKLCQTRYKDGDYDGDDISYYPSGRVSCWSTRKGKRGEPVGTGTAYKEDGTVLPTPQRAKP
jgi:hypothetical protein